MFISQLNEGMKIQFGHYHQGANGELLPIEWKVLKTLPGRALVMTEKILEWKPFHDENSAIRWEHSSLREWLLNEFFNSAFTPQEQESVFRSESSDGPDDDILWSLFGMETTTDSFPDPIFLLSASDVAEIFPNSDPMFCPGAAACMTPWLEIKNPDIHQINRHASWWLRSSFPDFPGAYIVSPVASVGTGMIDSDNEQGIRPAMWVKMEEE